MYSWLHLDDEAGWGSARKGSETEPEGSELWEPAHWAAWNNRMDAALLEVLARPAAPCPEQERRYHEVMDVALRNDSLEVFHLLIGEPMCRPDFGCSFGFSAPARELNTAEKMRLQQHRPFSKDAVVRGHQAICDRGRDELSEERPAKRLRLQAPPSGEAPSSSSSSSGDSSGEAPRSASNSPAAPRSYASSFVAASEREEKRQREEHSREEHKECRPGDVSCSGRHEISDVYLPLLGLTPRSPVIDLRKGFTASRRAQLLSDAVRADALRVLAFLADMGPGLDLRVPRTQETALMLAVKSRKLGCARVLLERGADPDFATHFQQGSLVFAIRADDPGLVDCLLDFLRPPAVDAQRLDPWLELCCSSGCARVLRLLLARFPAAWRELLRGNPNYFLSRTLLRAVRNRHEDVVRLLIEAGVCVAGDSSNGAAANSVGEGAKELGKRAPELGILLHECAEWGSVELLRDLVLRFGAGDLLESRNQMWLTPLLQVASEGVRREMFDAFLDLGADIEAADAFGRTALTLSLQHTSGWAWVPSWHRWNPRLQPPIVSALHGACQNNDARPVRWLLAAGLDPAVRSDGGRSPLEVAVKHRSWAAALELLRSPGVELSDSRERDGSTLLEQILLGADAEALRKVFARCVVRAEDPAESRALGQAEFSRERKARERFSRLLLDTARRLQRVPEAFLEWSETWRPQLCDPAP